MKNKCPESRNCYLWGKNPLGFTPDFDEIEICGIKVKAVVCPTCGRLLRPMKHPSSRDYFIIPSHNRED